MARQTFFTELSVCEALIMKQVWAFEGDIPVQTLITKLNEEYGKDYARTTVVTFISKLKNKKYVETYRIGKCAYVKAIKTEDEYRQQVVELNTDLWFGGKLSNLVASLFEGGKVSKEEADKIKKMLED